MQDREHDHDIGVDPIVHVVRKNVQPDPVNSWLDGWSNARIFRHTAYASLQFREEPPPETGRLLVQIIRHLLHVLGGFLKEMDASHARCTLA